MLRYETYGEKVRFSASMVQVKPRLYIVRQEIPLTLKLYW
jgi:hypothetical protein